jgi:hypothetical protein
VRLRPVACVYQLKSKDKNYTTSAIPADNYNFRFPRLLIDIEKDAHTNEKFNYKIILSKADSNLSNLTNDVKVNLTTIT